MDISPEATVLEREEITAEEKRKTIELLNAINKSEKKVTKSEDARRKGEKDADKLLMLALEEYGLEKNRTIFDIVLSASEKYPYLLVALLKKLLPDKHENIITKEHIAGVIDSITTILEEEIKDGPLLLRIVKRLKDVERAVDGMDGMDTKQEHVNKKILDKKLEDSTVIAGDTATTCK